MSHLRALDGTVLCEHREQLDHSHDHDNDHSHGLVDRSILRSRAGVEAVALSLLILALTAGVQVVIFTFSNSVALLADLIHNVGDALTAVPLGIAFFLRSARGEKIGGLGVVLAIFVSACVALYETVQRFIHPQHLTHLGVLAAAGVVGFLGNELAAHVRLSAGRRLASAALVADGRHARLDGFVSLGVVASAIFVAFDVRIADPIIGLVITLTILRIPWQAWHEVRHAEIDLEHVDHVHDRVLGRPPSLDPVERRQLERRTKLLAWVGNGWHLVEFAIALVAGIAAGSVALVGFGLDSLIEVAAAGVVIWLFTGGRGSNHAAERRAQQLIAASYAVLVAYIGVQAIRDLVGAHHPGVSWVGIGLAGFTAATMPLLAGAKRNVARRLSSSAAASEAGQNMICAYLSIALLVGLLLSALAGWWWADPVAALVIAAIASYEGVKSWRGESCDCC